MYFNCAFTNFTILLRVTLKCRCSKDFKRFLLFIHPLVLPLVDHNYEKLLIYHNLLVLCVLSNEI